MSDPKKDNLHKILVNLVFTQTGLTLDNLTQEQMDQAIIESFQELIRFATDYTSKIHPAQNPSKTNGFDVPEPNNIFRDSYGKFFE